MDLFEEDGRVYLVVVDYFSRFVTVHELVDSTSNKVVQVLQNLFCMIVIPNSIVSNNGPQFVSEIFKEFARKWDIQRITSSPR